MFENLIEQARNMLIQEKVGLITEADLVSWADETLTTVENAPDFLISISLGESLAFVPRLDLVRDPVDDEDCTKVALCMLSLYKSGEIGFDEIGAISYKMSILPKGFTGHFQEFNIISNELELVEDGIIDKTKPHQNTIEVLEKIAGCTQ